MRHIVVLFIMGFCAATAMVRRSVALGSHVIGVVDANNTTTESDEHNNTDAGVVGIP